MRRRLPSPRAAILCRGSTQSWATRAQRYSSTRASKPRYIQAPRRHRKGKPPTHLARPTAPAGSARPRADPTLPQLRHRARSTKHLPGRRAAQLYTERDGTTPAKTSRGAAEATANAAAPAPRHDTHRPPRHTATLQRNNHRAAPDTTATRPPYAKTQKETTKPKEATAAAAAPRHDTHRPPRHTATQPPRRAGHDGNAATLRQKTKKRPQRATKKTEEQ